MKKKDVDISACGGTVDTAVSSTVYYRFKSDGAYKKENGATTNNKRSKR